jgi:hypothetical protein
MIPKYLRYPFYFLAVFLPVQTILVKFLIVKNDFPVWLALWKELLGVFLILVFSLEISKYLWKNGYKVLFNSRFILIWVGGFLTGWAVVSSFILNNIEIRQFVIGARFELWWLWVFILTATWLNLNSSIVKKDQNSLRHFLRRLTKAFSIGFLLVCGVGFLSMIFGQVPIYSFLGFGTHTEGLIVKSPLCHPVDYNIETCRLAGGFSSPNHFAGYLILLSPIFIYYLNSKARTFINNSRKFIIDHRESFSEYFRNREVIIFLLSLNALLTILIFLTLSFARYAWLVILYWVFVMVFWQVFKRLYYSLSSLKIFFKVIFISIFIFPLFGAFFLLNIPPEWIKNNNLPEVISKPSSSIWHYRRTQSSVNLLLANTDKIFVGYGLGATGPAAGESYTDPKENPIVKENYQIGLDAGIYPEEMVIPENWYIQTILNGGVLYALAYLMVLLYPIKNVLNEIRQYHKSGNISITEINFSLAFTGIIFGNVFLHIFENQTIVLYWTLIYLFKEGVGLLDKSEPNRVSNQNSNKKSI